MIKRLAREQQALLWRLFGTGTLSTYVSGPV